jgi:hypothetical protein
MKNLIAVSLVYGGLLLLFAGACSVLSPTRVAPYWRPNNKPTAHDFTSLTGFGFTLAFMNSLIEEAELRRCLVTTETRAFAADDPTSRRKFGEYWRLIYPGCAFIPQTVGCHQGTRRT